MDGTNIHEKYNFCKTTRGGVVCKSSSWQPITGIGFLPNLLQADKTQHAFAFWKKTSLQASKPQVQNYVLKTNLLTGVKCRVTSIAKNCHVVFSSSCSKLYGVLVVLAKYGTHLSHNLFDLKFYPLLSNCVTPAASKLASI